MFRPSQSPPCPPPTSPLRNPLPESTVSPPKGAKVSPERSRSKTSFVGTCRPCKDLKKQKIGRKKKRSLESRELDESCAKADEVNDLSLDKDGPLDHVLEEGSCSTTSDIWEFLSLSWPLPAPLSPLPLDELVRISAYVV